MEIWKDIKGYEGLYQISNYGNVRSLRKNKLMKPEVMKKGYLRIGLSKNNQRKRFLIHVLVASHFISDKPSSNAEVNHKDLNKSNNRVDNLEWVTPSENIKHAVDNIYGRKRELQDSMSEIGKKYYYIGVEKSKKPVIQIDKNTYEVIGKFESAREAARRTGSNYKNISQVCRGERKTHNGYIWRFADKEGATTIESTRESWK